MVLRIRGKQSRTAARDPSDCGVDGGVCDIANSANSPLHHHGADQPYPPNSVSDESPSPDCNSASNEP